MAKQKISEWQYLDSVIRYRRISYMNINSDICFKYEFQIFKKSKLFGLIGKPKWERTVLTEIFNKGLEDTKAMIKGFKPFMKIFWQSKKISWRWLAINSGISQKQWIWNFTMSFKYKQLYFLVRTPLFTFHKNNGNASVGFCFGKYFIELYYNF